MNLFFVSLTVTLLGTYKYLPNEKRKEKSYKNKHASLSLSVKYPGYPVSQSGQEVLCSRPAVYQQHWRFSPPPYKPHHCYLSGRPQGLPVPLPRLLRSTSTPTSPVHPLHPHCRLQCTMVRSGSRPVNPTPGPSTAWASTGQHLPAPGPLPCHGRWAGPDSWAGAAPGFPSDQHSAEVCQQPRRTQR